jgi:type IV secretion system protein VirD4
MLSRNDPDVARALPLGWTIAKRQPQLGFRPRPSTPTEEAGPIEHAADSHLLTVAPTGGGKGRCAVIPALLTHPGSSLTIDLKGENYQVTARRRREMGHTVVALDPFRLVVPRSEGLNPFDLFSLPGGEPDCDAELLADLVAGEQPMSSRDLFWELSAKGFLTGLIGLAAESTDPAQRNPGRVLDLLYHDDVDYNIAVALDTHTFANKLARQELVAYLQHESERCRPSVRSTAQAYVKSLGARAAREALSRTTFDLAGWVGGEPIDIYLIFPPDRIRSHRAILRLWVGTLISSILRRPSVPSSRTLLLLDEIGQLGPLPQLLTAITLLRGYGVQVWTFWQDLAQLKSLYPTDWETVLNNTAVIQAFGLANGLVARTVADLLGVEAREVIGLGPGEQFLLRPGAAAEVARRVDYLTDPIFAGRFDPNPRHSGRSSPAPIAL